jgi:hypothetical protein
MIEVEGPSGPKSATLMPAFPPRSKTWAPWWVDPWQTQQQRTRHPTETRFKKI